MQKYDKHDKIQKNNIQIGQNTKEQNTCWTKYNETNYKYDKKQSNKIQLKLNTKIPKYKLDKIQSNKIQKYQNANQTKSK